MMSAGFVRLLRLASLPRLVAALLFALAVWVAVLGLRGFGGLEVLELRSYDALLSMRAARTPPERRITVVAIREADLERYGWPIRDGYLADALGRLLAMGPRAVGLDVFRDRPEEPGHARLAALLAADPRLVVAMKYPGRQDPGVSPPPSVADPARVGFVDMVVDDDGTVRRGLLFLGGEEDARWSMALRLALAWLAPLGVGIAASDPADPAAPPRLGEALLRRLPPDPVGYAATDPGGWQFLMSYPLGHRPPPLYGFGDVLEGRVPEDAIRDGIVLVGTIAASVKDQFLTPLAGERTSYGVLLHAQTASQLLREALGEERPLLPVPPWLDRLWALAWCLAGGLGALLLHGRKAVVLYIALAAATLVGIVMVLFLHGYWIGLIPPLAGGLGALILVGSHLEWREAAERAALSRLFAVHLSSRIADHLWAERTTFMERGRPRPLLLEGTALFSDVSGFTPTAERLDPPVLMEWLDDYFSRMAEIVARHGGIVYQFVGDGLVAVFGPPLRRTAEEAQADARAAVDCALAMAEALGDLATAFRERGLPEIRIRVGINKGPLIAGSIGSADRAQYVLVGDTMNTAARLESWREPVGEGGSDSDHCRILVSEGVWACLGSGYRTESAGLLRLKGKSRPTAVYRVVARPSREGGPEERNGPCTLRSAVEPCP